MSRLLRNNSELIKLIYEIQNETASSNQLKQLATQLRDNPEAQMLYVFLMDMHAELILEEDFLDPEQPDLFSKLPSPELSIDTISDIHEKQTRRTKKQFSKYLLLILIYFCPLIIFSYITFQSAFSVSHTQAATIDEIKDGQLMQADKRLSPDAQLSTGYIYHLEEGVARIVMNSGAEVVLESPASFELLHHNSMRLRRGALAAEVLNDAVGFVVETPSQRVVDLGTRFGVRVNDDGSSETHVFQGKVVCTENQNQDINSAAHLLAAGQALQVNVDGTGAVPLLTSEDEFSRSLAFQAQIEELEGAIQFRQQIPKSIGAGDFTSDQFIRLFQEQKNLTLSEDLTVWKIPSPNDPTSTKEARRVIPKGTRVNVFLLHLDGPHQGNNRKNHKKVRLSGAVHFKNPVLGGFKTDDDFYATDESLGHPGVIYDNEKFGRSGRSVDVTDLTVLSQDGKLIEVSWQQRGGSGIGRDQIRIIVAAE